MKGREALTNKSHDKDDDCNVRKIRHSWDYCIIVSNRFDSNNNDVEAENRIIFFSFKNLERGEGNKINRKTKTTSFFNNFLFSIGNCRQLPVSVTIRSIQQFYFFEITNAFLSLDHIDNFLCNNDFHFYFYSIKGFPSSASSS